MAINMPPGMWWKNPAQNSWKMHLWSFIKGLSEFVIRRNFPEIPFPYILYKFFKKRNF